MSWWHSKWLEYRYSPPRAGSDNNTQTFSTLFDRLLPGCKTEQRFPRDTAIPVNQESKIVPRPMEVWPGKGGNLCYVNSPETNLIVKWSVSIWCNFDKLGYPRKYVTLIIQLCLHHLISFVLIINYKHNVATNYGTLLPSNNTKVEK